MKQTTIARTVEVGGKGLHKGGETVVRLNPSQTGQGITILDKGERYALSAKLVSGTKRGTSIKFKKSLLWTIEHLVSAIRGTGVDNVEIEFLKGNEPPILDGSARGFVRAITGAGVKRLKADIREINIKEPFVIKDDGAYLAVLPYKGFKVHYFSDFSKHGFGPDECVYEQGVDDYYRKIAGARTFGFKKELEWLMKAGLIKGADMSSAVLLDKGRPVNTKLRYKNEMTRHKVLDVIGDFGLINGRLNALVVAVKTGHRHNIEAVKKIIDT